MLSELKRESYRDDFALATLTSLHLYAQPISYSARRTKKKERPSLLPGFAYLKMLAMIQEETYDKRLRQFQKSWFINLKSRGDMPMLKVKTFTNEIRVLHAMKELEELDAKVNDFIVSNKVSKIVSVSDSCTSGDGNTIGIIRVMAYETS